MEEKAILTKPPLIEMVLGVQFNKIVFSNNSIIQLYNSFIGKNYPKIGEKPYLNLVLEEYNKPTITKVLNGFHTRKLFISEDDCKLIQIQSDKMLFNWRKRDESLYPRFHNIYDEFKVCLNSIDKTIKCIEFINQYEISYIDHFQLELFNLSTYNISKIFNFFNIDSDSSNIGVNLVIPKEKINGNLNVTIQSAVRNSDNKKILVLDTTCRGFTMEPIDGWFITAHDIIYKFFFGILNDSTKKILGLQYE